MGLAHATYHAKLVSSDSGRVPKAPWGHSRFLSKKGLAGVIGDLLSEVVAHIEASEEANQ